MALRDEGRTWTEIADVLRFRWPELTPRAAVRLARGWSQRDAAEEWNRLWPDESLKAARDFSCWERWPVRGRRPSLTTLDRMAQIYECNVSYLLSDVADYRHLDKFVTGPLSQPGRSEGTPRVLPDDELSEQAGHLVFGPGPVTVAIPLREAPNRALPVISSEDALAAHRVRRLLDSLSIETGEFRIPPHGIWEPPLGDLVAICGPKCSPVVEAALAADPFLAFEPDGDSERWIIRRRGTPSETFGSPMDADSTSSDVAYLGRLTLGDRAALVIAGIHALGSVGAVDYLTRNLGELRDQVGRRRFSMVIHSDHAGEAVTASEPLCPPLIHP